MQAVEESLRVPAAGFVAFLAGGAAMVAEIGVVRLAMPVLGASQPVWAAAIAGVLLASATGNALGGRLARRGAGRGTVGALLAAAGLAVALLPFALGGALQALAVRGVGGIACALIALGVAGALPVLPLGAVTPALVRAASARVDDVGPAAGRVGALATAGALAGTLGTTFLLTPLAGTARTFAATGGALLATGLLVALRRPAARGAACLGGVALAILPLPEPRERPGEERLAWVETPYAVWQVTEGRGGIRWLVADEGATIQSYLDPAGDLQAGVFAGMAGAPLLAGRDADDPARVFIAGLGGGTAAREMILAYPRVEVTGCEIDPAALALGRSYFDLPSERFRATAEDGRVGLAREHGPFDAIVVDAFRSAYVPPHLVTREFMALARSRLVPGGVLVLNLLSARGFLPFGGSPSSGGGDGPLVEACARTAATIFGHTYLIDAENGLNILLVATDGAISGDDLARRAAGLAARRPSLARALARLFSAVREAPRTRGEPLTDDRSPVDWLTHALVIERLWGGDGP